MKDPRLYLLHISECIRKVEDYTSAGKESFLGDTKTQDAVLRNLQTLAESTQRLPEDLKAMHPDVPWRAISGFRNLLVHNYLGVSLLTTWEVCQQDLPGLKKAVEAMLSRLSVPSPEG